MSARAALGHAHPACAGCGGDNAGCDEWRREDAAVRRPRAIKRPRVPPGPLADLKALLYELYLAGRDADAG